MNTSITREIASEEITAIVETETATAVVLTLDELASVAGGRKVNEYEGQH